MRFELTPELYTHYPHLIAQVIIINGFTNTPSLAIKQEIIAYLRKSEEIIRMEIGDTGLLLTHPYIKPYLDLFRSFGVNPKKVKPSHVALIDRILRGGRLPDINPAVNLYNAYSLRYTTPLGGEDLDTISSPFQLTIAQGDELWIGIGETSPISPKPGDIIWKDVYDVSTLSLNWRQCEKTKLTDKTTNAYFVMEGFDTINQDHIIETGHIFAEHFTQLLGGKVSTYILTKDTPIYDFLYQGK